MRAGSVPCVCMVGFEALGTAAWACDSTEVGEAAAERSRPEVKAEEPAPVRIMTERAGSEERREKRGGSSEKAVGERALCLLRFVIVMRAMEGWGKVGMKVLKEL